MDEDEEDDGDFGSVASVEPTPPRGKGRGRASRVGTDSPAPDFGQGKKRKRGGAGPSVDPSVDEDDVRPKVRLSEFLLAGREADVLEGVQGKKRKGNKGKAAVQDEEEEEEEDDINVVRRAMRECYDALMRVVDPETGDHRIDLFRELVNRKLFADCASHFCHSSAIPRVWLIRMDDTQTTKSSRSRSR